MQISSSLATRLEYQYKALFEVLEGFSDEQIRRQPENGKWSGFQQIVHLLSYQELFLERVRVILTEDNPRLERYIPDTDPAFLVHCKRPSRVIVQEFISSRRKLISKFADLKEEQLQRSGVHPVYGQMILTEWLQFFLLHEAHHLFAIFKLLQSPD